MNKQSQVQVSNRHPLPPELGRVGLGVLAAWLSGWLCTAAVAHDYRAGDIRVVHPYATPSLPGAGHAAGYVATLENTGEKPDRLLSASTALAGWVELRTMSSDAEGGTRTIAQDAFVVLPGRPIRMRPGQGLHFMLMELKRPLKEGDTFSITMQFERGGKVDVKMVVQVPKPRSAEPAAHRH